LATNPPGALPAQHVQPIDTRMRMSRRPLIGYVR
jgi:hypothetical protein